MNLFNEILIILTLLFPVDSYFKEDNFSSILESITVPVENAPKFTPPKETKSPIEAYTTAYSYIRRIGGGVFREDNSTVTGYIADSGYDIELIERNTWIIQNKLGTGFIHTVIFEKIPKEIDTLNLVITFPEMTLANGKKRSIKERPIDISGHNGVYEWFFEYYFDELYETNPGIWQFQISSGEEIIYKSEFTVVNQ